MKKSPDGSNRRIKPFLILRTVIIITGAMNGGRSIPWQEVIPHRENVLLENVSVFKDFLVLGERKNGIRQIRVLNPADRSDDYLQFNEEAYVAYPKDNYEFDTSVLRYVYTSMTTPVSTFEYNMKSKESILLKEEEVGGIFNRDDYQSERLWAVASDGTPIPVSVVYRKGLEKNGKIHCCCYMATDLTAPVWIPISAPKG